MLVKDYNSVKDSYELTKILNNVQVLQTKKDYIYNKMEGINSKPELQQGGETLLEIPVMLPLHISLCDPEGIIKIIEEQAQLRKPFDWVYNGKYMGQFVINSIDKIYQNRVKDVIIYAEVTLHLLEQPANTQFLEQITGDIDLKGVEQYSESSNKIKDFAKKAQESIVNNIKESVATSLVSDNLTDSVKELLTSSIDAVVRDTSGVNITSIYTKTSELADKLKQSESLNLSDVIEICTVINNIPGKMLSSVLRKEVS